MARLLVVDDDERLASLVARALARDNHEAELAYTGTRALELALVAHYDMLILDLVLPGIPGLEVLRRLREQLPHQRVLVLSATSEVSPRVAALELGAADFLPKPFAVEELLARVRVRLRSPVETADQPSASALQLDHARRSIRVDGRLVALSEREYELLHHLMTRPGTVCSRAELLLSVWGLTFDPGSNVVDVSVRRLRSKIGQRYIETVRNVGYAFLAG
ncbi:DNA-binding response OmpR family regulator [Motilibacter peucedani]|uniref:DNA-binding response OmpR family regulator n=1 Tax=Motilibacter peucedani TaxID=598650 RepID=A0A420XR57_9ACTN|nr:response regulator transcription factor [Motilibacter peucedani]RKS77378.1 DNA-binding response OmpR family regulator [Motilibacter peucedani]